jgi:hypothetical protein
MMHQKIGVDAVKGAVPKIGEAISKLRRPKLAPMSISFKHFKDF